MATIHQLHPRAVRSENKRALNSANTERAGMQPRLALALALLAAVLGAVGIRVWAGNHKDCYHEVRGRQAVMVCKEDTGK